MKSNLTLFVFTFNCQFLQEAGSASYSPLLELLCAVLQRPLELTDNVKTIFFM